MAGLRNVSLIVGSAVLAVCVAMTFIGLKFADTAHASGNPEMKKPVLVELFTSEGCSSCPPADALLQSLDRQQNIPGAQVIVLSEHVDYWDHEGWRDPFSSAEVTARQDAYVSHLSHDGPFTPEAVIDGARSVNGSDRRGLVAAIEEAAQRPKIEIAIANAAVNSKVVAANLKVEAHPRTDLYAVLADDHDESSVSRGENSGRHLEHVAVARVIKKLGTLNDGFSGQIRIAFPSQSQAQKIRLVIFAQERGTGQVLGVSEANL